MAFCEQCGGIIGENAKFCRNCGHQIEKIGVRIPVKENASQVETAEEQKETEISHFEQVGWKAMRQKGLSTGKQWWTVGTQWIKQKVSALWHWKWGKVVISAVALIVITVLVLPHIGNRVIGKCSYCYSPVKASEMGRCPSCDRPFGNMVPILSVDGTKIVYEGEKAETGEEKPQNEKKTTFNDRVDAAIDARFDEEEVFIPDYRPGYENTTGNFASNWNDGGNIMEQDGWIYYDFGSGLYKMPIDGSASEIVALYSRPVHNINVLGDWIYCTCGPDVLKIRTDGQDVQTIGNHPGVSQGGYFSMVVIDQYLFYMSQYQTSETDVYDTLHRIDLKTMEDKVLLDERSEGYGFGIEYFSDTGLHCWTTKFDNGDWDHIWVGLHGFVSWSAEDEFGRSILCDDTGKTLVGEWKDEKINHQTQRFFTIKKEDRKANPNVSDDTFFELAYEVKDIGPFSSREPDFSAFGNYVVFSVYQYSNKKDAYEYDEGIFLVNCKTGEITKVNGDHGYAVQYAGGYLYYHTDSLSGVQYRCKLDGSDWSEVSWMCP